MKTIAEMSLVELAAYVSGHLACHDTPVVLVGGGCVSVYSNNKYQTQDIDFVERYHTHRKALKAALEELGFQEQSRYFVHPEAKYFLEFPQGPLAVGDTPVHDLAQMQTVTGVVTLLTPEDCIRDRLAAYYHWRDYQSLTQAVWVALNHSFDIDRVRAWSVDEGAEAKFDVFLAELEKNRTNSG